MIRIVQTPDYVPPPPPVMEEITDPEYNARATAEMEKYKRNSDWLQAHWADVLPQARGKYVAVAGQQAFIADTAVEARAWCDRNHPGDSPVVQYVRPGTEPRIYVVRW
jgi:hypothetical protein